MKTLPVAGLPRIALLSALVAYQPLGQAGGRVAVWGDSTYGQRVMPNGMNNIKAVAAGNYHSLALRVDGSVVGWGQNTYGQSTPPPGLGNVIAIAAGGAHSLALRADGTVVAWGYNSQGQTTVPVGLAHVRAIAAGGAVSLALKSDGTVAAWGYGGYGLTNVPTSLSNVVAISANSMNALALRDDGTVVAWGYSYYGVTNVPAGLSNVTAISAGMFQSLALGADGRIAAWGSGEPNFTSGLSNLLAVAAGPYGNLALTTDGRVVGWTYDGFWDTNAPAISNATAIAVGVAHALAIVSEGPPELLEQPIDAGVQYQSNITLSATASGNAPLFWQWYFDGSPLANSARLSGATTATLSISNAQFSDIGRYTFIVSNALGAVQSTGALLTVISPPLITQHPTGQTVIAGTNLTLTAAAIGTPPLGYQWLRDGLPVPGATANVLAFTNIQSGANGSYSLLVTNAYGTNESLAALVTVLESPPYILKQPTNVTSILGGLAKFAVDARGSAPIAYQWRCNGVDLPGATNALLTLSGLRYNQAGFYTVALSNAFGLVASAKAELIVQQVAVWGAGPFTFSNQPPMTNLTAIAAGDYYLLGLKSDGTVRVWFGLLAGRYPGTSPTNIPPGLNSVTAIAAGSAHCLALRSNGTVTAWGGPSRASFPVPGVPATASPTNVPAGLSNVIAVAAGDNHCLALNSEGHVVSWGYSGGAIGGGIWLSYTPATNVPANISNVIAIAAGGARNLALRSDGRVLSWGLYTNVPANLSNVIAVACADDLNLALRNDGKVVAWTPTTPLPPFVRIGPATNVPVTLSNAVAVTAGNSGVFGVALTAGGLVTQWGNISSYPPPLGLSNVFAITAGNYLVATLVGDGSPHLTIQPASQTVNRGATVRLTSRAVGVQPMLYQWQRDGLPLAGATNADLTLTNVEGRLTGAYRVVVANSLGAATSIVATLAVPYSTNLAVALNATNLVWTTSPTNAAWFAQNLETHDGDVAAQSGRISHSQQSQLDATVVGPGTLKFWWKVSSEQSYDRLWFSMDAMNWATWISGEVDWSQYTYHIPSGSHVVHWTYLKDNSVSTGQDAAWLDEVSFTPSTPVTFTSPLILPDGTFRFETRATSEHTFEPGDLMHLEVQTSTNLHQWSAFQGICTLTNGNLLICDPGRSNVPQRFYRVIEH